MPLLLSAFASGLLFGLGLIVSRMVDPAKVLGFLDIVGNWDPSLAFVMGGAVAVSALGYRLAKRRGRPVLAPRLEIPTRRDLDPRLIGGAALFGIGWGLVGLCPGPALTALTFGPVAGLRVRRRDDRRHGPVPACARRPGRRQPSGASPQARPTTPDLVTSLLATGSRRRFDSTHSPPSYRTMITVQCAWFETF